MTSLDRTIYCKVKCICTSKELIEAFIFTERDRNFVRSMTRFDLH